MREMRSLYTSNTRAGIFEKKALKRGEKCKRIGRKKMNKDGLMKVVQADGTKRMARQIDEYTFTYAV